MTEPHAQPEREPWLESPSTELRLSARNALLPPPLAEGERRAAAARSAFGLEPVRAQEAPAPVAATPTPPRPSLWESIGPIDPLALPESMEAAVQRFCDEPPAPRLSERAPVVSGLLPVPQDDPFAFEDDALTPLLGPPSEPVPRRASSSVLTPVSASEPVESEAPRASLARISVVRRAVRRQSIVEHPVPDVGDERR